MSDPLDSKPDPAPDSPLAAPPTPSQPSQPPPPHQGQSGAFGLEEGGDFGIGSAVKATVEEFKSLEYSYLLPFRKILSISLLRKRAVRWVIGFGLFPLVLLYVKHKFDWSLEGTSWWLGGYFCLLWATCFSWILHPQTNIWQRGAKWALFTVVVGSPLLLLAQHLPVINAFYSGTASESFLLRLAGFVLGVGVMEETCKAVPFLLFALRRKEVIPLKAGIFLGMMSGFGFALAEIVQYSVRYWGANATVCCPGSRKSY